MIKLAFSQQRKKLILLTALCAIALFVSAAGSVTNELLTRPEQRAQGRVKMRTLTEQLILDTSSPERAVWRHVATADPVSIITACTESSNIAPEKHAANR